MQPARARACRCATPWRWARCTARPSCCPCPRQGTLRSCRGWPAGATASWTPSCARRSRWRCTPAPRRRCWWRCASEVSEAAGGLDRAAGAAGRPVGAAARRGRTAFERAIERRSGAPGTIAAGLLAGSAAMVAADRVGPGRQRARARMPGRSTRCASAWRRRRRSCPACRATAPPSPPRALRGFGREDANALSRHVALPIIAGGHRVQGRCGWRGAGCRARCERRFAAGAAAVVRLHAGFHLADPPGRARPLAGARTRPTGRGWRCWC